MQGPPKTPVQAWTLNPMMTVVWAPILPSSPVEVPTPNPRQGVALRLSLDATREPIEDDPLSDQGGGNGDQDMPDANEPQGDPAGPRPEPVLIPNGTPEGAQLFDDQAEAGDDEEPQELEEP